MVKVKPPSIPISEDPQVTIANLKLQISVLLDRVETLTRDLEVLAARQQGWRDCAREIIGSIDLPLLPLT